MEIAELEETLAEAEAAKLVREDADKKREA